MTNIKEFATTLNTLTKFYIEDAGIDVPDDIYMKVGKKLGITSIEVSPAVPAATEGETDTPAVMVDLKDGAAVEAALAELPELRNGYAEKVLGMVLANRDANKGAFDKLVAAVAKASDAYSKAVAAVEAFDTKAAIPFTLEAFVDWDIESPTAKEFKVPTSAPSGRTARKGSAGEWQPGFKYQMIGAVGKWTMASESKPVLVIESSGIAKIVLDGKTMFAGTSASQVSKAAQSDAGKTTDVNAKRFWDVENPEAI